MRRDQTRAPEPMRSTLPNTDQPRIPHSEYHYNWRRRSSERVDLGLRDVLPGALLSPTKASSFLPCIALHFPFFSCFGFIFFTIYLFPIVSLSFSSELGYLFVSCPQTTGPSGPLLCDGLVESAATTALRSSFSICCLPVLSLRGTLL